MGSHSKVAGAAGGLAIFGDGSDGDITISENTLLTRDMFYNTLTVNEGITLSTKGYRIFVKETFTNNGTIENNGGDGGDGLDNGGAGGVAGAESPVGSLDKGGAGGSGADGKTTPQTVGGNKGQATVPPEFHLPSCPPGGVGILQHPEF